MNIFLSFKTSTNVLYPLTIVILIQPVRTLMELSGARVTVVTVEMELFAKVYKCEITKTRINMF